MANTQMLQQQYGQYQEQLGQYGRKANEFNMAADVYNRQVKEYQALVDAYKALPGYQAYEKAVADYNVAAPAYNEAVPKYNAQFAAQSTRLQSRGNAWDAGAVSAPVGNTGYTAKRISSGKWYIDLGNGYGQEVTPYGYDSQNKLEYYETAGRGSRVAYMDRPLFYDKPVMPTQPTNTVADQAPGEFTAKSPGKFTEIAPKDPGFTGQQVRQLQGQQTLAQQEKAGENETGLIQRVQGQKQRPDSIIGGMLQNVRYST